MPTEKPRYTITLDEEMLKKIDDFRFENRFPNRTQATLELIRIGMEALEKQQDEQKRRKKQDGQNASPVQIGVDEALSYINGEHPINRFAAQKGLADSPENREFTKHLADALHKDIHKTLEDHRNEKD